MEIVVLSIYLFSSLAFLLTRFFKQPFFYKTALFFLSFGFLSTLLLIAVHLFHTRRLPLTNTSETLLSIVALIVFVFLVLAYKKTAPRGMGFLVSSVSLLGLLFSFHYFKKPAAPLLPALQTKLLVFHVSSCIIAYCFFTIAFIVSTINLIRRNSDANGAVRIMHRSVCVGFLFLTVGIILGSFWGKYAWGHWWNWDPKETWALITWFIYARYFHGRLFGVSSEKRLATIAIVGFLACLFTYFGVTFLLKGLHSYA